MVRRYTYWVYIVSLRGDDVDHHRIAREAHHENDEKDESQGEVVHQGGRLKLEPMAIDVIQIRILKDPSVLVLYYTKESEFK